VKAEAARPAEARPIPFPCDAAPSPVRARHATEPARPFATHDGDCAPACRIFPRRPAGLRDNRKTPVTARANPFATCHLESIPFRFPQGMGWDRLLKRLEELNWCASIVGGNGSGKTTLIEQLVPHLEARGFQPLLFRLQTESGMKEKDRLVEKLREVKKPGFILLDGAEQLSTRQWLPIRGAASEAAGFIVTVHRTSRLPVALELETSPKLFKALVENLTGGALPEGEAETLFHRHRGNLRDCLRELYDRWAG